MSLIMSLFLELGIIFPFILHVCTAADMEQAHLDALLQIRPSNKFRRECEKLIRPNKNRDLGGTSWNSIRQECMLFCAFNKIEMMDANADLYKDYVESKVSRHKRHRKSRERVYKSIRRCSTGSKRHHVCVKAIRNAYCMFDYLGDEWIEKDVKRVMMRM